MRLIDADALHNKIVGLENLAMETLKVQDDTAEFQRWQTILGERTAFKHDVFDAPTIDAVPVVRCRECRWWDKIGDSPIGYCHACKHGYYSSNWEISINRKYRGDFYCANGERKGGAE